MSPFPLVGGTLLSNILIQNALFISLFLGVFQSLQKGFTVDARDIDAAINNICEESLPLETNMTSFLHATCGHFQKLVNEGKVEAAETDFVAKDEISESTLTTMGSPRKQSVRFLDFLDESDG